MTTFAPTAQTIPGYITGTWDLDASHSEVAFSVRHLMLSKVRGRFATFSGSFVTAENPADSHVEAVIALSSIDTNSADRDAHLRNADFFDVEQHPTMTYRSTAVRAKAGTDTEFVVDGLLTLHGITREVPLDLEVNGFTNSPFGDTRAGFSATGSISRKDFGIEFKIPMENGGVVVGDKINIALEIEAILKTDTV